MISAYPIPLFVELLLLGASNKLNTTENWSSGNLLNLSFWKGTRRWLKHLRLSKKVSGHA